MAVEEATHACELTTWKLPRFLDTLAAALAEVGQFEEAITTLQRALELPDDGRSDAYRARLERYRTGQPFRFVD
jgi:serine/threonine-protein kinase